MKYKVLLILLFILVFASCSVKTDMNTPEFSTPENFESIDNEFFNQINRYAEAIDMDYKKIVESSATDNIALYWDFTDSFLRIDNGQYYFFDGDALAENGKCLAILLQIEQLPSLIPLFEENAEIIESSSFEFDDSHYFGFRNNGYNLLYFPASAEHDLSEYIVLLPSNAIWTFDDVITKVNTIQSKVDWDNPMSSESREMQWAVINQTANFLGSEKQSIIAEGIQWKESDIEEYVFAHSSYISDDSFKFYFNYTGQCNYIGIPNQLVFGQNTNSDLSDLAKTLETPFVWSCYEGNFGYFYFEDYLMFLPTDNRGQIDSSALFFVTRS